MEYGKFTQVRDFYAKQNFAVFFSYQTKFILEPGFWLNNCRNLLWLRNHVVAPLSEEFTFRACMLPLLLQTFTPMTSVFITPLFFGVGKWYTLLDHYWMLFYEIIVSFSSFTSHDWTSSKWNGKEDSNYHFILSILLHFNLWNLFCIFVCSYWTLYRTIYSSCIL